MPKYPIPANELERIQRLKFYELMGKEKDPDLDVFSQAARLICDCPVAFITIMGEATTKAVEVCKRNSVRP